MHDVGALKKRYSRCTIACSQERRASARRGVRYERCAARINALLADDATPEQKRRASARRALGIALAGRFGTQSRDTSRAIKSGGRQPAVDVVTASATAFVHGRPAGRRCAAIVVLPLQARYTNHGWLTPAAPDARRRCTEKTTFAVHNRMFPRAAGVSPPWMW
jgi:hypothetical protein